MTLLRSILPNGWLWWTLTACLGVATGYCWMALDRYLAHSRALSGSSSPFSSVPTGYIDRATGQHVTASFAFQGPHLESLPIAEIPPPALRPIARPRLPVYTKYVPVPKGVRPIASDSTSRKRRRSPPKSKLSTAAKCAPRRTISPRKATSTSERTSIASAASIRMKSPIPTAPTRQPVA